MLSHLDPEVKDYRWIAEPAKTMPTKAPTMDPAKNQNQSRPLTCDACDGAYAQACQQLAAPPAVSYAQT
jgi:hypothetical protein